MKIHVVRILGAVAVVVGVTVSFASIVDGRGDDEAASSPVGGYDPDGGVAAPPLPLAVPDIEFDPATSVASLDGTVIATGTEGGLEIVDGTSGAPLARVALATSGEVRAVSASGRLTAVFAQTPTGGSTISVVDAEVPDDVRVFTFDGLVEPEAFATDGSLLYVIDHQVSTIPGAYRVRPLNLATGELEPMLGPTKLPLLEDMNGSARRQFWSVDGSRLYTLYVRQTHHHHPDGSDHAHGEPGIDGFVHVLDLDDEWAHCLDLPPAFGGGDIGTTALAIDPSGSGLAVLDWNAGQIAFASTDSLSVTDVRPIPTGLEPTADLHLALTRSQLAVAWDRDVRWFDGQTLEPTGAATLPAPLQGLTSIPHAVLAWTDLGSSGPVMLDPPA